MSVKKQVKQDAGWRCVKCNAKPSDQSSVHAHHIVPESEGGKDTEDNLAVLCRWCHDFAPDNGGLVDDFEAVFEDFVSTGVRPEFDILTFGMDFGVTDGINEGAIDGIEMTASAMTDHLTTENEESDSQSGIVNPDSYWLIAAAIAGHGTIRQNVADGLSEPPQEFEDKLMALA